MSFIKFIKHRLTLHRSLFRDIKYSPFNETSAILVNQWRVLVSFLFLSPFLSAQFSLSPDAYKLFTDKSSSLKLSYRGYSSNSSFRLIGEKLSDNQNLDYAKLGIRIVTVVRELNGMKDTLAIRKYNSEGFLIERDTFNLNFAHNNTKYLTKIYYSYYLKDKFIKVKSLEIVIKPDTAYEWQSGTNMLVFYDSKNRMACRKFPSDNNDTTSQYFKNDSNNIVTGITYYRPNNAYANVEEYDYTLDEKGRLTRITRYYKYNPQSPFAKWDGEAVPDPRDDGDSTITRIIYDDKKRSVTIYPEKSCHHSYYIKKKRQVYIAHFCTWEKDSNRSLVKVQSHSSTIYTSIFDRQLRLKSVRAIMHFDGNYYKKGKSFYQEDTYTYNRNGLLSTITNTYREGKGDQKIFFYYSTK